MKAHLVILFSWFCFTLTAQTVTLDINQDYIPVLTHEGDTLISSVPYGNHWVLNGVELEEEINQILIHPKAGTYVVYVIDLHTGCASHSDSLTIIINSVPEIMDKQINLTVFPNPNNGLFDLTIESVYSETITLELLALDGKKLAEKKVVHSGGKQVVQFGKAHLASGIYNVRVHSGSKQVVQKVVVE